MAFRRLSQAQIVYFAVYGQFFVILYFLRKVECFLTKFCADALGITVTVTILYKGKTYKLKKLVSLTKVLWQKGVEANSTEVCLLRDNIIKYFLLGRAINLWCRG